MDDFYQMPGHLIRRAHQVSTAIFTDECAEFGLTAVQYAALSAIEINPQIDATRLSSLIAFDRSTIGDVLERMEAKGWITRASSARDRRIKRVSLSPEGAALLRAVEPAVRRVQERLLAPLAPHDRDRFMQLLLRLTELHNEATLAPLRAASRG
jgi:DNA-binding MarR family transcriptional regulator